MLPDHIVRKILHARADCRRSYLRERLNYHLNHESENLHNYHIYEKDARGNELFAAKLDIFEEDADPDALRIRVEVNKFPYWNKETPWTLAFDFCVFRVHPDDIFSVRTCSPGEHAFFNGFEKQSVKWYWEYKSIIQMSVMIADRHIKNRELWDWFVGDLAENPVWRNPMRKTKLYQGYECEQPPTLFGEERRMRDMFLGVLRPECLVDRILR